MKKTLTFTLEELESKTLLEIIQDISYFINNEKEKQKSALDTAELSLPLFSVMRDKFRSSDNFIDIILLRGFVETIKSMAYSSNAIGTFTGYKFSITFKA